MRAVLELSVNAHEHDHSVWFPYYAVVPEPYQAYTDEYPWLTIWVGSAHDAGGCCPAPGCEGHQ